MPLFTKVSLILFLLLESWFHFGKERHVRVPRSFIFRIFEDKNLLSKYQSGFRPGDSYIYQLLGITYDIFSIFDCNPTLEIHGVFLDISKAFDRVWHDGLLFKLEQNDVSRNLFQLIKSFLSGRFQRVLLNGQTSDWETRARKRF